MRISGSLTPADAGATIPIARAADTTANEIFVMIHSIVKGGIAPRWKDTSVFVGQQRCSYTQHLAVVVQTIRRTAGGDSAVEFEPRDPRLHGRVLRLHRRLRRHELGLQVERPLQV